MTIVTYGPAEEHTCAGVPLIRTQFLKGDYKTAVARVEII